MLEEIEEVKKIAIKNSDEIEEVKKVAIKNSDEIEEVKKVAIKNSDEIEEVKKVAIKNSDEIKEVKKITIKNSSDLKDVKKKFNIIDKRFDKIDDSLDFLARKMVELSDTVSKLVDNQKSFVRREEHQTILNTLDAFVKDHLSRKQEADFTSYRVRENTKDIDKIKPLVGIN